MADSRFLTTIAAFIGDLAGPQERLNAASARPAFKKDAKKDQQKDYQKRLMLVSLFVVRNVLP